MTSASLRKKASSTERESQDQGVDPWGIVEHVRPAAGVKAEWVSPASPQTTQRLLHHPYLFHFNNLEAETACVRCALCMVR